jgi:cytochrome c biogenesis protein CcdA/thiol-disulfide isomerase/thioredoxin
MTLLIIAYLGGVLTIFSPCILPILPFVFSRTGQPFLRSTLPMLFGMVFMFAAVASLAAVGGSWAIQANEYGRLAALVIFALLGVSLLSTRVADGLTRPAVVIGNKLLHRTGTAAPTAWSSMLLGLATGLLWAPCAGPILGLVLTGAALKGANVQTTLLLVSYAAGATSSLAIALLVSGKVFKALKGSLGVSERLRQALGVAVLAGVVTIGLGLDTTILARFSYASTSAIEQALLNTVHGKPSPSVQASSAEATTAVADKSVPFKSDLPSEGKAPSLDGAVQWLNSPPLSNAELKGKVVLVDFWTYSCINCIRTIPYVRAWAEKYKDQGLVVIGVHAPEFAFEKNIENVRKAVADFQIGYPVAIDNDYSIWRSFSNNYWPAHYLIDAAGQLRYSHFGEGSYRQTEKAIQDLLREAGRADVSNVSSKPSARGAEVSPNLATLRSGETYVGYNQASNFVSPGGLQADERHEYTPGNPGLNEWGLSGAWTVGAEAASLNEANGSITYRFSARDLHLVLGPGADGKPVRFRVKIDGKAPRSDHGTDTDAEGNGVVSETKLYQLVRQMGDVAPRTFEIQFLDPDVQAYAFTFG